MSDSKGVSCRPCGLSSDLIGREARNPEGTAEDYYEALAPIVSGSPFGTWDRIEAASEGGWGWETPVGVIPFGPTPPKEVLDFLEEMEKPWPKADPRREGSQ